MSSTKTSKVAFGKTRDVLEELTRYLVDVVGGEYNDSARLVDLIEKTLDGDEAKYLIAGLH